MTRCVFVGDGRLGLGNLAVEGLRIVLDQRCRIVGLTGIVGRISGLGGLIDNVALPGGCGVAVGHKVVLR